jgi:adenylosuccinate synthase
MPKIGEQGIVVIGAQWGDEGKGGRTLNIVEQEQPDLVIRFGGGNNAGHQQEDRQGRLVKTHLLPVGVLEPKTFNVIGNACYVDPVSLMREIDGMEELEYHVTPDNLMVAHNAHLTMAHHISHDELREAGKGKQGSTKRGIAPTAGDKYLRVGLQAHSMSSPQRKDKLAAAAKEQLRGINSMRKRAGLERISTAEQLDAFMDAASKLGEYVGNATLFVNQAISEGKTFVGEGHQGTMLDLDHGMYPYGTSANTIASSFYTGMGVAPSSVPLYVESVAKLTESRVGGGHLVTEIKEDEQPELLNRLVGEKGKPGAEYGATSGRKRRMAHLSLPELRYSDKLNNPNSRSLTKLDCLPAYGRMALICVAYRYRGQYLEIAPNSVDVLKECEPVYVEKPLWDPGTDTCAIREFDKLPSEAQNIVKFVDDETGVTTDWIGVGPHRGQYIKR